MVGGKIHDKWIWDSGHVAVLILDNTYADDYAEIRLVQNEFSLSVDRGGSIWWQGPNAYWTPKDGSLKDQPIPRIGYSVAVDDPAEWRKQYMDKHGLNTQFTPHIPPL